MKSKSETMLNERDSLTDMLEAEKQLMNYYAMAIEEGSSRRLRQELLKGYTACGEGQFSLFNEMSARGYYEVQPVNKMSLDKKIDEFEQMAKQL